MKILIALDGSECSKGAIDFVLARPWLPEDSFVLVHVVEPIPADMGINYVPTCTNLCDNAIFDPNSDIPPAGRCHNDAAGNRQIKHHTFRGTKSVGLRISSSWMHYWIHKSVLSR